MRLTISEYNNDLKYSFLIETSIHGSPRPVWYLVHNSELHRQMPSNIAIKEYQIMSQKKRIVSKYSIMRQKMESPLDMAISSRKFTPHLKYGGKTWTNTELEQETFMDYSI